MSSLAALWHFASSSSDDGWFRALTQSPGTEPREGIAPEDAALFARIRHGDETAFKECYETHYDALWRFANRLITSPELAQDVVQDVFFALFTRRESLAIQGSLRTYLFGAVRHRALNMLRHDTVVTRVANAAEQAQEALAFGTETARPDDLIEQQEIEIRVTRALAMLPERQRSAMVLRWEHGMTTAQIARALGVADTVAGRLLLKAAKHLREILRETTT